MEKEQKLSIPRTINGFIDVEKLHGLCAEKVQSYYPGAILTGLYVRTTNAKCKELCEGKITFDFFDERPVFLGLFKENIQIFCSVDIQEESVQLEQSKGNQYFIDKKQELSSNEEFERVLNLGFTEIGNLIGDDAYFKLEFWQAGISWNFMFFSGANEESSKYKCFRITENSSIATQVLGCDFGD